MIAEKVADYFRKFPNLRVLFFFDEDREYEEEVKNMSGDGVRVVFWENTPFTLKYNLLIEYKEEKVFLYLPLKQPVSPADFKNFPLTGLLLANKELQLDDVGAFMEKYGLQRHQKTLVSRYIKELKYKKVQDVCLPVLKGGNFQERGLQQGLVSSFLDFSKIEPWPVLVAKLLTWSEESEEKNLNRFLKKVRELQFEDVLIGRLKNSIGFPVSRIDSLSLQKLARIVLYNKLTQTLQVSKSKDPYASLKIEDPVQLTELNQMLREVDGVPALKEAFDRLMERMGEDIRGEKLIEVYGSEAAFSEFNTAMAWTVLTEISGHIANASGEYLKRLEILSLQIHLPAVVQDTIKYLIHVAKTHQLIQENSAYVLDTPEAYIERYTAVWYKVDAAFRRANMARKTIDHTQLPASFDMEAVHGPLNDVYDKHTFTLNNEWLKCLSEKGFNYSEIRVPKQYDFYKDEIAVRDQKVAVIISDALRYEAGYELLTQIHGDGHNTAEIGYMLASIPSKTNIGMAQLLPGNKYEFGGGKIKIDGISSESTYRTDILRKAKPNSLAIQYEDLDRLDLKQSREIFKNDVVYIYHDVIDSTGDKRPSERRTFTAVQEAIDELKHFVNKIHHTYNVAKVYVTADHGFLYNDKKIEDKDLEQLPSIDVVLSHNRYYATIDSGRPDLGYCLPLRATTKFEDELYITIPFSVNRYRKAGTGHQFVHGGGSLQELVVPLIESSRKRVKVSRKVNPILLDTGNRLRVVSNILKTNILQENEISRLEKERVIMAGLYKDTTLVSNEVTIDLNATSELPSERLFPVELLLNPEYAGESFLKLKIFDAEDKLNPIIEERVQNNTIIPTDF